MLADTITRSTLAMLTGQPQADRSTLEVSAKLLGLSTSLDPGDAERLRLSATLAEAMNNPTAAAAQWADYVKLAPSDDAALLKLAIARVNQNQTLDGRVAAIDKLVNAPGAEATLTPALRSRLAMIAAEATREIGDGPRYLTWLRQAARLDGTNAHAAAAVYAEVFTRNAGPKALGAAAKNWVEANPTDPQARLALATFLASEAVYIDASQQYANASRMSAGQPLPWSAYRTWTLCLGAAGDTPTALLLIENLERMARPRNPPGNNPGNPLGNVPGANLPGGDDENTSEGGIPLELELVRLVLLEGWDHRKVNRDRVAIDESYRRVVQALHEQRQSNPLNTQLQLAWIAAAFGPNPADVQKLLTGVDGNDPLGKRALGWMHLRQGQTQWAKDAFKDIQDDPMAKLGSAFLLSQQDLRRGRMLRDVVRSSPRSLAALIAAISLRAEGRPVQGTAEGEAVRDLMQQSPVQVWRMDLETAPWLSMQASVSPRQARPFEPVTLTLSLTNNGPVAVAIGEGQALRPLAFVDVAMFRQGEPAGQIPTQVVDIGRRLRLEPGETMTVSHRLDWSALGLRLSRIDAASEAFAVSVLLDPRVDGNGRISSGPFGMTDTLRGLSFPYEGVNDPAVDRWLSDLSADLPRAQMIATARLASLGNLIDITRLDPQRIEQAHDVLSERAASLDPVRLSWLLWHLPGDRPDPAFQHVYDSAQRSSQDLVLISYLVNHVNQPDHPAMIAAMRSGPGALQRFANLWAQRLNAANTPTP
jgi:tetratricopeptide (TPR) repeat protein